MLNVDDNLNFGTVFWLTSMDVGRKPGRGKRVCEESGKESIRKQPGMLTAVPSRMKDSYKLYIAYVGFSFPSNLYLSGYQEKPISLSFSASGFLPIRPHVCGPLTRGSSQIGFGKLECREWYLFTMII